jgi:hypothetical protein
MNWQDDQAACLRCASPRFNWLKCTCTWQCNRVINCNGLHFRRHDTPEDVEAQVLSLRRARNKK